MAQVRTLAQELPHAASTGKKKKKKKVLLGSAFVDETRWAGERKKPNCNADPVIASSSPAVPDWADRARTFSPTLVSHGR